MLLNVFSKALLFIQELIIACDSLLKTTILYTSPLPFIWSLSLILIKSDKGKLKSSVILIPVEYKISRTVKVLKERSVLLLNLLQFSLAFSRSKVISLSDNALGNVFWFLKPSISFKGLNFI